MFNLNFAVDSLTTAHFCFLVANNRFNQKIGEIVMLYSYILNSENYEKKLRYLVQIH